MTYQEAKRRIKEHNRVHSHKEPHAVYITEALNIAIVALEKQIPKKAHISLHGTTDWNTKCRCPVCRKDVFGTQKYCGNCGQALDWGGAL